MKTGRRALLAALGGSAAALPFLRSPLLAQTPAAQPRRLILLFSPNGTVLDEDDEGRVAVLSKGIGVGAGGRVGSVTYRDVVVRVDGGWRLASRTVVLRRPDV